MGQKTTEKGGVRARRWGGCEWRSNGGDAEAEADEEARRGASERKIALCASRIEREVRLAECVLDGRCQRVNSRVDFWVSQVHVHRQTYAIRKNRYRISVWLVCVQFGYSTRTSTCTRSQKQASTYFNLHWTTKLYITIWSKWEARSGGTSARAKRALRCPGIEPPLSPNRCPMPSYFKNVMFFAHSMINQ